LSPPAWAAIAISMVDAPASAHAMATDLLDIMVTPSQAAGVPAARKLL
jgi:hypothetical protein